MPSRERARSDGFSLIEILVVVLIIGLLSSLVATQLLGQADKAKISLAGTKIRQVEQMLELYKLDNGRYPTQDQGLLALVRKPETDPEPRHYPPGGYLKFDSIQDPWQKRYEFRNPGTHNSHSYDLFSFGPDGVEGSGGEEDDDIVNWYVGVPI